MSNPITSHKSFPNEFKRERLIRSSKFHIFLLTRKCGGNYNDRAEFCNVEIDLMLKWEN